MDTQKTQFLANQAKILAPMDERINLDFLLQNILAFTPINQRLILEINLKFTVYVNGTISKPKFNRMNNCSIRNNFTDKTLVEAHRKDLIRVPLLKLFTCFQLHSSVNKVNCTAGRETSLVQYCPKWASKEN
jgi:hypothetical protein